MIFRLPPFARPRPAHLVACALLLGGAGCSSTQSLTSEPAASPVTIDGSDADWTGTIRPVESQPGLGLGVRNDGEALYVAVVLRNEAQVRQVLRGGLTLWLDPDGGKDKALGIRFPLGTGAGARPGGGRGADGRPAAPDAEARGEQLAASSGSLEVLHDGAASGARRPAVGDGIQAAATLDGGVLVAEYRIPLADGSDALRAAAGGIIGLGLATTAPERPERPDGARGGRGGGGRGAGGGRGGAGGGRGGRGGANARPDAPSPLSVWVGVELAGAVN